MIARAGDIISLATPAAWFAVRIVRVRIGGWALIISRTSATSIEQEHGASWDHNPCGKRFHLNRNLAARCSRLSQNVRFLFVQK